MPEHDDALDRLAQFRHTEEFAVGGHEMPPEPRPADDLRDQRPSAVPGEGLGTGSSPLAGDHDRA